MTGNNKILIENKKPFETVQELKNETPNFEEFMKTYEVDENLNYDDLTYSDISEIKGYGPCSSCSGSNRNLTFKLKIHLLNCMGGERSMTVYNTDSAHSEVNKIVSETGHWEDEFLDYYSQGDRKKLANKIKGEISWHKKGHEVDLSVCNKEMPDIEKASKDWAWDELEILNSEPYPGERSGGGGFLD